MHAIELSDQNHSHGFAYASDPTIGRLSEADNVFLQTLLNLTSSQLSGVELRQERLPSSRYDAIKP